VGRKIMASERNFKKRRDYEEIIVVVIGEIDGDGKISRRAAQGQSEIGEQRVGERAVTLKCGDQRGEEASLLKFRELELNKIGLIS
jgi:hypothetical protein